MAQTNIWEQEYKESKLVTKSDQPQNDVLRFIKFLKKQGFEMTGKKVLDLGSGTGRNSNYLAELGNEAAGMEISGTAIRLAQERAWEKKIKVKYLKQSFGEELPFVDGYFDLVLDVTSSNSLDEKERSVYLKEVHRILNPGGYFFVRALCKEGDKNAKELLKRNPGPEKDTYIMEGLKLKERVFERKDFIDMYSEYFKIITLLKKTSYTRFNNQSYKRNFWLAYLKKDH